jgi:urate oxidase
LLKFPSGLVHTVKELEVSTRLTLATDKDYLKGDNSDIIATDSQKNVVYLLAQKHGVKSPEDFAILLCQHFLTKYKHVVKTSIHVEEVMWNRVNYGDHAKLHNHAFIHTPICTRSCSAFFKRGGVCVCVDFLN